MIKNLKTKIGYIATLAFAMIATVAMKANAGALDAMNASSTPTDFATAAKTDLLTYLYPVLGIVFGLGLIIAVVWFVYRKLHSLAKGKH